MARRGPSMLDKLRRQFILIIMALVTAALAIMSGVIIYINYQQLHADVVQAVEYATSEFAFEARLGASGLSGADASTQDDAAESADGIPDDSAFGGLTQGNPPDGGQPSQHHGKGSHMERGAGADMVATSVYMVKEGAVSWTLVDALELGEDELQDSLAEALAVADSSAGAASGGGMGALQAACVSGHVASTDLYYGVRETLRGTKVAFARGSYVTNSIANLGKLLAAVSAGVWAAFLAISILLARWVVRPTERAWSQQQQFVADASHELKTPLAVMMANNSILLSHEGETIESQRRWVESNQTEARQMLELVNDMLFLARPDNAERQLVYEDVDLSALVQRNTLQFEAVCFERGVQLEEDVAASVMVRGDANRLQRLASTLIDNACKYADSQVKVSLARVGNQAKLAITNDGAIIPPEDLEHVFDRFYRVDKARVRSEGGVGLGLAIAQEVAHEHGGAITVASSEDAGTIFTATLPCA